MKPNGVISSHLHAGLKTAAALAALLALAACGGTAQFELTGTFIDSQGNVKPMANPGLVLANGDDRVEVGVGATSFKFPKSIAYGTEYSMYPLTQPKHMTCSFMRGASGTAGRTQSIAATVYCAQNAYTIGGTVTGVSDMADNDIPLVLVNGSAGGTVTISKTMTTYTFGAAVADGSAYGVAILTQPANLSCTIANAAGVANNTGIMGEAPRSDINLTCVKK